MKNKRKRQQKILSLIESNPVGTQEELMKLLKENTFFATQATLSRDIQELGLRKVRNHSGMLVYATPKSDYDILLEEEITRFALRVERAEFMVIIQTTLGKADILANILDESNNKDILGTIAGADTIFIAFRDREIAKQYENTFKHYL